MYKSTQLLNPNYTPFKESAGHIDPWRSKIDTIGRSKGPLNRKYRRIFIFMVILMIVTFCIIMMMENSKISEEKYPRFSSIGTEVRIDSSMAESNYNSTYPFTNPKETARGVEYRIAIITDMDRDSQIVNKKNTWQSFMRAATLTYDRKTQKVIIKWQHDDMNAVTLFSSFANGGRGMELSELLVFNGHLYSVDDRTGIVYEIENENKIFPWIVLPDGDGHEIKGFKGEWMVKKGEKMIIGGIGKEWTTPTGVVLHHNPQWVKIIEPEGKVVHRNWTSVYMKMQEVSGYTAPGYIIHESAAWSDIHNSWFFLPRRASHEKYNDVADEERGTNLLFKCSEYFDNIQYITIGDLVDRTKGFSSFKFLPGTGDQVIVALKTYEYRDKTKSFITVFTITGKILLPDTQISDSYKYEGLEFL